jgi:hypothetical protein
VYKATLPRLGDLDGDGLADDYGQCVAHDLTGEQYTDPTPPPPPGLMSIYLVTAENETGESSLGETSAGLPRPNRAPCP